MTSSGYSFLNSYFRSVCPHCGLLNASKVNWCMSCGCLLTYNDPGLETSFARPLFTSPNFPLVNNPVPAIASHGQIPSKSVHLGQPVFGIFDKSAENERNINPCSSMSSIPNTSGSAGGSIGLQPIRNTTSTNLEPSCSAGIHVNEPETLVSLQLRQRCISSPCSNVAGLNQEFRPVCGNHLPDSKVIKSIQQDHSHYLTTCRQAYLSNQYNAVPFVYFQNEPFSSQSIDQLSELFMACDPRSTALTYSDMFKQPLCRYPVYPNSRNNVPQNMHHFGKRGNHTQKQSDCFRNRGSNIRNGKNHDRNIRQVKPFNLQPFRNSTSWRRKPRQKSFNRETTGDAVINLENESVLNAEQGSWSRNSFEVVKKVAVDSSSNGNITLESEGDGNATRGDDTSLGPDWLQLPTELWLIIVRYLSYANRASLAQTCCRLGTIVTNQQNWRIMRLDRYQHLTDSGLAEIGKKRPQQLHFTFCHGGGVTYQGIKELFKACGKSLECLSFVGCSEGAFQGDLPLLLSASNCPNLSHIDASYTHSVRDQTVRSIAESSVALKSLLLNGAQYITNSAIQHLVRHHKNTLERLELFGCFHLNSQIFTALMECHALKALAFGFIHRLSSSGLIELVSKLPLLASLDLRGTQELITDASLSCLAKRCPLLEEIVLANSSPLTSEDGVVTMLQQLPRLRVLDLCGLSVVGDTTLQALAVNCPLLEELDISCTSVTDTGLLFLANAPATCLKSIRISYCPQIKVSALEKVVVCCAKLTKMSLYGFSCVENWDFLFNLRSNLVIQTETQRFKFKATEDLNR